MFKTVVIAALGFAAVSAQFLDVRNLQNTTTVSFAAACSVAATGVETGCNTAGYCCAAATRTGTAVTAPANLCVNTDFLGQNLTIAGTTYSFARTCLSANITAPARVACTDDSACEVGSCCSNATLTAGLPTANGTVVRRFCNAGTGSSWAANYAAPAWLASYTGSVRYATCTPVEPPASFGAYIKASVMMVVAVLSVALF
jgi:hypothetical protein